VGIAANFVYNMRRTLPAGFNRIFFLRDTIGVPLLLALPCLAILLFVSPGAAAVEIVAALLAGSVVVAWPAWRMAKMARAPA
jgi:hypothetical protein